MIHLFLTAQIIWTLATIQCGVTPNLVVAGCYSSQTNTIQIKKDIDVPIYKEYTLYHEIGHSLYLNQIETVKLFPATKDENTYEVTARYFAYYILAKKHNEYTTFYNQTLSSEQRKYFRDTCNTKCVKDILKVNLE